MRVAHDDFFAQSWSTNFGPNPFNDNPPDYTQNTADIQYVPMEAPPNNHPPSLVFPKISGGRGSPVTRPLNPEKKITMKFRQKNMMMEQMILKKLQMKTH